MKTGARVDRARIDAGLSQRALAERTGISQPTLSRIIADERVAKVPELVAIAWATGSTLGRLTGATTVSERVECAPRATNRSTMAQLRAALEGYLELDEYLEDNAVPASV